MALRKSTKIWLAVFAGAVLSTALDSVTGWDGPLSGLLTFVAVVAGLVLVQRLTTLIFRAIVRRLTLRLAFSYFLIGIVPIPLLALLLAATGYLIAFQIIAGRVKREVVAIAEEARPSDPGVVEVKLLEGKVARSPLPWLPDGHAAGWRSQPPPHFLLAGDEVWLAATRNSSDSLQLLPFHRDGEFWVRRLADRTGYVISVEGGSEERTKGGFQIRTDRGEEGDPNPDPHDPPEIRPRSRPAPGKDFWEWESLAGVYLARPAASFGREKGSENVVLFVARTPPKLFGEELFSTWIPGAGKVVLAVMVWLAASLLVVYLVALVIAFVLVGAIARNVNRMTRASEAIGRGDFTVRVNSKSRDQIGDLARSFDGMTASIQRLLRDTARKERLESEIAIARTIQQKLLPPPEQTLPGLSVLAHFQSVAEIGGDYYDYFRMPDGRSAVTVGDVSGHGLPTGLLAAMAKAALSTLIESGVAGSPLFARLNELIHRSTDSRNYMTLSFFAFDPKSGQGELTNAGQLAPYHFGKGGVTSLELPSFPLGVSARSEFPTKSFEMAPGDLLLFFTDGFVEAVNPSGEPYGFERLEALLRQVGGAGAEKLRDAVLAAVEEHAEGRPADDDRTMVILTFSEKELE